MTAHALPFWRAPTRSFWLATGIATSGPTSGQVQLRKSAIHGLPVTLRMLRVKSDKSDWFWSRSIVFTKPFKTRMSLNLARGPDFSSPCQKGPLGTRLAGARQAPGAKCNRISRPANDPRTGNNLRPGLYRNWNGRLAIKFGNARTQEFGQWI